ncbi:MAG: 2-C-methyl-D-erythritol 4-phosphate cytidylyltransferase [Methylophilus sp.]|nr:2-C-methyl-D-erythritol 4-phosphate cytidylyltransferase [Methylophilus sp.]
MALFHVIIPAAGSGSRMGAEAPKQYLALNGKPLIQHVIEVFEQAAQIHSVHVVLSEQDAHWRSHYLSACAKSQVHYCGGESRAQTVLNGLSAVADMVAADDWVLVHDAARPGLTNQLLDQFTSELAYDDVGGLLALPVADTLKKADSQTRVAQTISREQLWQAQTPQMFKYATLKEALTCFKGTPTDEAEAIEALGLKPKLVIGALRNLKVTYPQDLAVLSALLNVN